MCQHSRRGPNDSEDFSNCTIVSPFSLLSFGTGQTTFSNWQILQFASAQPLRSCPIHPPAWRTLRTLSIESQQMTNRCKSLCNLKSQAVLFVYTDEMTSCQDLTYHLKSIHLPRPAKLDHPLHHLSSVFRAFLMKQTVAC